MSEQCEKLLEELRPARDRLPRLLPLPVVRFSVAEDIDASAQPKLLHRAFIIPDTGGHRHTELFGDLAVGVVPGHPLSHHHLFCERLADRRFWYTGRFVPIVSLPGLS
jgi:hypothetical protein